MKKILVALVVVASVLTACKNEKKQQLAVNDTFNGAEDVAIVVSEKYNVDLAASVLNWKGTKPLGAHDGVVSLKNGSLVLEEGKLIDGEFVIDMNSIKNVDMKGTEGAGKIEGHLMSADFFDVAKYPTSKFVVTSVKDTGAGKIDVTGKLTIKDVTKTVTIPAMISTNAGITTFKSETFKINRTDYNVKYGSKSFFDNLKDKFIDDIMEMSFVVKTKA
ncbi:YceI family protein [uncultured Polaribacter sp.]|uniref:YceI family protein n=1 Tax=uncultured Polaribacter sp. TaxID=174711 RepID=UPI0027515D6F|nr:YceI family protein [Polaribacter sp.]|tara:strand:- start:5082 stop:5735 length:654 start_codon:yes stop_codon:yes gene_type:complete